MYINPIAKARFENQKAIYKEENEKLKERWEKERAAEEKAARIKENDLIGAQYAQNGTRSYRSSSQEYGYGNYGNKAEDDEDVFEKIGRDYAENARKEREIEEKRWEGFGDFFAKEGGVAGQNANQRNETFMKAYENGEDWLMNGDDDSMVKAIINRSRSAFGEGVEDLAYLINDVAPWYKPAKEVVDKNVAGNIAATADRQFEKAKEKTGDFGDRLIDGADNGAEMLGLSILGPKAFTYVFGSKEGFEEYRAQRENGTPQELAFKRALAKTGYSIIEEKVEDFIGKNNPIDNVLYINNKAVDKFDDETYNRANKKGSIVNDYYNLLTKQEWAKFYSAVAERGKLNAPIGDNFVWGENGIVIYAKKVKLSGTTSGYQIVDYEIVSDENAEEIAYYMQQIMDESGD